MQYRELGKTKIKCSVIGFGGIPIQRGEVKDSIKAIAECEKQGVNYIDTARGYTTSEAYLGESLKGKRDKFFVATKSMVRNYEGMLKEVETSLSNLQTDYIDLYQLHNLPLSAFEEAFGENGAYRALKEYKDKGIIKHIGATAHSIEAVEEIVEKYSDKIETIMFPFNIIETQGVEVLKKAKEKGIGTIAMKPLAGGNILNYDLAIRYILDAQIMDIVLIGMGDDIEVQKNTSIDFDKPISAEDQKEIIRIREEIGTTFCRRCGYCGPCTVGINIPNCFTFNNYYKHYEGLKDWAIKRYASMDVKADECVECGACEARCPYNLPIREMLKEVVKNLG